MASYDLNGKVALITGAARGIGFGTAQALVKRGATVVVVDLDQAACDAAAAQLHDTKAMGVAADVTDRGALQRAVAATVDRFGGLDVVYANAGIAPRGATFRAMSGEAFDRVVDVDLFGVARTVEATLPQIIQRKGHVVMTASVYAFMNGVGVVPYAMAKAAVEQLGRALRVELQPYGASASVAYFGFIDTEMVHQGLDEDPIGKDLMTTLPRVLRKRLTPAQAGEAVARGIEKRAPRIIVPKRWRVLSSWRGLLNPLLDVGMERQKELQELVQRLDARESEEQPTTRVAAVGDR